MGYCSNFYLEIIPKKGEEPVSVIEKLFIKNLISVTGMKNACKWTFFEESIKWYDQDIHCRKASSGITNAIIIVSAVGEDGNTWVDAYFNGKKIWHKEESSHNDMVHIPFEKMVKIGFLEEAKERYKQMGLPLPEPIPEPEPSSEPESPPPTDYLSPLLDNFLTETQPSE